MNCINYHEFGLFVFRLLRNYDYRNLHSYPVLKFDSNFKYYGHIAICFSSSITKYNIKKEKKKQKKKQKKMKKIINIKKIAK